MTESALSWLVALAALLAAYVLITGWIQRRSHWHSALIDPDSLAEVPSPRFLPRFFYSVGAWAVVLLAALLLVGPAFVGEAITRGMGFLVALSCAVAAVATFLMLGRTWQVEMAYGAMILLTLSFCVLIALLIPADPSMETPRYAAMSLRVALVGFAMAACFWIWLSSVWHQQLDQGQWWTTTGRLIPHARRFSGALAVLALVAGWILALLPRWLPGGDGDESPARLAAATAGYAGLLGTAMFMARYGVRLWACLLGGTTLLSMALFWIVRIEQYSN